MYEYILGEGYKDFRRKMVFKPHNVAVIDISFSEKNPLFATTAADGTVFFFDIRSKFSVSHQWTPLKFVRINSVTDLKIKILHDQFSLLSNNSSSNNIISNNNNSSNNLNNNNNSNNSNNDNVNININKDNNNITLCEKISWKVIDNKDIVICSCTDGVIREFEVQDLVKSEEELSLTVDLHTFETSLPLTERILKIPVRMLSNVKSNNQSTIISSNIPPVNSMTKSSSVTPSPINSLSNRDILASQVLYSFLLSFISFYYLHFLFSVFFFERCLITMI